MAELTTIARPYAKAAFEYALGSQTVSEWASMLDFVAQAVSNNDVAAVIGNPALSAEQKGEVLLKVSEGQLTDKVENFIKLLAKNHRLEAIPAIKDRYEFLKANYDKAVDVEVTSAMALSDEQLQRLTEKLTAKLGRKVKIETQVDSSMIGGLRIKAGDMVIDGSVRGKLDKLSETLRA
ncbi:MAG: F0F1 ATP synthase subunit delta [Kangiellaceae bacterium]|nr:F0F1 ATP synthase subunit delta [Kangiellaceae bacterium]